MTTERRGLFVMKTSPDGTKCAAECPFLDVGWTSCRATDATLSFDVDACAFARAVECAEAESAAREAEVDALRRGYEIARDHKRLIINEAAGVAPYPMVLWSQADSVLNAEFERIRRGVA